MGNEDVIIEIVEEEGCGMSWTAISLSQWIDKLKKEARKDGK